MMTIHSYRLAEELEKDLALNTALSFWVIEPTSIHRSKYILNENHDIAIAFPC